MSEVEFGPDGVGPYCAAVRLRFFCRGIGIPSGEIWDSCPLYIT